MDMLILLSFLLCMPNAFAVFLRKPLSDVVATSRELAGPPKTLKLPEVDEEIKNILWRNGVLIDGFYAVRKEIYEYSRTASRTSVVFSVVTSVCHPSMPKVTLEDLYGPRCPRQAISRMWICRAEMRGQTKGKLRMLPCSPSTMLNQQKLPNLIPDDRDLVKHHDIIPERQDVMLLIALYLLEVATKEKCAKYYEKLQHVLSARDVGTGFEVQFAIAPSTCDTTKKLSLEEIYSPKCVTPKVHFWKLCNGTLYKIINYKPHITCQGTITSGRHKDISVSQKDLYIRHLAMENAKLKAMLQKLLEERRVKFENHLAMVDSVYKAVKIGMTMQVEFSIKSDCQEKARYHDCDSESHGTRRLCTCGFDLEKQTFTQVECMQFFTPDRLVEENIEKRKGLSVDLTESYIKEYLFGPQFRWHKPYLPRLQSIDNFVTYKPYAEVEFTLSVTRCTRNSTASVDDLYSNKCRASTKKSKYSCCGKFNHIAETAHKVKCEKVKELSSLAE
uniref:Uncharacterized protein n=1 Tax=Trichuris muris TaxID=70415 RepID=A0A5S6R3W8_TRIMR